jgi:hypothetical protein
MSQTYPYDSSAVHRAAFALGEAMAKATEVLSPDQYTKAQERAIRFARRSQGGIDAQGNLTVVGLQVVARQLRAETNVVSKRSHR